MKAEKAKFNPGDRIRYKKSSYFGTIIGFFRLDEYGKSYFNHTVDGHGSYSYVAHESEIIIFKEPNDILKDML
jgi:hypothetical protein